MKSIVFILAVVPSGLRTDPAVWRQRPAVGCRAHHQPTAAAHKLRLRHRWLGREFPDRRTDRARARHPEFRRANTIHQYGFVGQVEPFERGMRTRADDGYAARIPAAGASRGESCIRLAGARHENRTDTPIGLLRQGARRSGRPRHGSRSRGLHRADRRRARQFSAQLQTATRTTSANTAFPTSRAESISSVPRKERTRGREHGRRTDLLSRTDRRRDRERDGGACRTRDQSRFHIARRRPPST